MTEVRIAQELIKLGVAREDIILGFIHPSMREYTEYGVV